MTADILTAYESRHIKTYTGLKQLVLNLRTATDADTIDLATLVAYKNTYAVVAAATAKNYDEVLDISRVTTANTRYAIAIRTASGALVPAVLSSTATLTLTLTGLSEEEVELVIFYR